MTDPTKPKDQIIPIGKSEDGEIIVVQKSERGIGIRGIKPVKDGEPLLPGEDLFKVTPATNPVGAYDMETVYESPYKTESKGPAKVSSPKYREGWDAIFGDKPDTDMLN
jgi:hypothetical protein